MLYVTPATKMHLNLSAEGEVKSQHCHCFTSDCSSLQHSVQVCLWTLCAELCSLISYSSEFLPPSSQLLLVCSATLWLTCVLECVSPGPLTAGPLCGAESGSSLLMRHCSLLPSSHSHFIFLSSFTLLVPFVSPSPLFPIFPPPMFHLALCPSTLLHGVLFVFPQLFSPFYPPLLTFLLSVPNSNL